MAEIAELNKQGKNIISLGIGSPDAMPSSSTIEAVCNYIKEYDAHGYQSYAGIPELREPFKEWYYKWFEVKLDDRSEILPLMGSNEGVFYVSLTFLNPGDKALIPNPGYPTYSSVTKLVGGNPIFYELDDENGWLPDLNKIEKENDLSNVKLMWVNYPNMPTGARANLIFFEELVQFGKKHNIVIVNDNPYSFILNEEKISILQIEGAKDICIELNSMSKSHNMAGWRIGMILSNKNFIKWVLKVKSNIDIGQFKPLQMVTVEALKNDEKWHHKNNFTIYGERREVAEDIFNKLDCKFNEDQVGMFLWGKIPDEAKSGEELSNEILYKAGVFITPGFIFGSRGDRYLRISLCSSVEKLQEALDRIKINIKKQKNI